MGLPRLIAVAAAMLLSLCCYAARRMSAMSDTVLASLNSVVREGVGLAGARASAVLVACASFESAALEGQGGGRGAAWLPVC